MKAAVIGTGTMGCQHLACLRELAGVEIAGVCDLSPALAEAASERYGVPRWFTSHAQLLEEVRPDVIHITTPPPSHFELAMDAMDAGAHVLVEKPIATSLERFLALKSLAEERRRVLVEDQNYLFNPPLQQVFHLIESGAFGQVCHVEAMICVNILGPGSRFADRNAPHPCLSLPGGVIADFLTHLASVACAFVGPHLSVRTLWSKRETESPLPSDEFRALLECRTGTAALAFSSHSQPDAFWVQIHGTKMQASANLFESTLTFTRTLPGSRALMPFRNGLREALDTGEGAVRALWRRLSGRVLAYEGMWELVARLYTALRTQSEPPVSMAQMEAVNRLVADLTREEYRI